LVAILSSQNLSLPLSPAPPRSLALALSTDRPRSVWPCVQVNGADVFFPVLLLSRLAQDGHLSNKAPFDPDEAVSTPDLYGFVQGYLAHEKAPPRRTLQ